MEEEEADEEDSDEQDAESSLESVIEGYPYDWNHLLIFILYIYYLCMKKI